LLPFTESLKDQEARLIPYWTDTIAPLIKEGKRVLIVTHGSSIRTISKHLDSISEQEIAELNIPTGE
jgi:2,3-bisphosphoglycerate-dependent phosphoglycerate mutase